MDSPPPSHSFVVKVWTKEGSDSLSEGAWRGHVTHVEEKERRYVQDLLQIPAFIGPYVAQMGGEMTLRTRLCLWLIAASSTRSTT